MKTLLFRMGAFLLPAVFMFSCADDEKLVKEKVQHTFTISPKGDDEGRGMPFELPDGASLLISLSAGDGDLILDQQSVRLERRGDTYVSEPIELPAANYSLVDFMVVDDSLNVLYATPLNGSALSEAVAQSLPLQLPAGNIARDIGIEVIDARNRSPKHFGYDAFRRGRNSIKLQVFVPDGHRMRMTTAEALVMKGLDTLQIYPLAAKMNAITFSGTGGETYTLVVVKDSYTRYTRNFSINDPAIKRRPIRVVLEPALSVVALPIPDQNYFGMQFDAWGVFEFDVDWGDGTRETWTSGITTLLEHNYAQPGKYFVTVTGHALDSALLVGDLFGAGNIERLGMRHLTNLRDFRMEWASGPKTIDLSNNHLINEIRISQTVLEDLDIPNDAAIYILELIGNVKLRNESLNEIIFDLHHQVVNSPPHTGDFLFYLEEDGQYVPITEPTPQAWEKLRQLKHEYGWVIIPDPDI